MTAPIPAAGAAPRSAARDRARPTAWDIYLDRLEAAASAMDDQLLSDTAPDVGPLGALTEPDEPMPPRLGDRRKLLVALLEDVTARAAARRDDVAAQLASLARRTPGSPADAPASLGRTLDVMG